MLGDARAGQGFAQVHELQTSKQVCDQYVYIYNSSIECWLSLLIVRPCFISWAPRLVCNWQWLEIC